MATSKTATGCPESSSSPAGRRADGRRGQDPLNKTLGNYSDNYQGNVRRIITGTLDECVRRGVIPRHTLSGIELAPAS